MCTGGSATPPIAQPPRSRQRSEDPGSDMVVQGLRTGTCQGAGHPPHRTLPPLILFPGRQQQLDAKRLEDYVNADHDLYCHSHRSVETPAERPGERRQAEMKRLYGDSAAKIQAMEAAVQLSFDKHCDTKRPKYWPVIPLKF